MRWILATCLLLTGCTTSFVEFRGECVYQEWNLLGYTIRRRNLCDLPPPTADEVQVRDREPMSPNPFPDLLDRKNPADSMDPNLLEKRQGLPPSEDDLKKLD